MNPALFFYLVVTLFGFVMFGLGFLTSFVLMIYVSRSYDEKIRRRPE